MKFVSRSVWLVARTEKKDKEENTRKWPKKGSQKAKNQNSKIEKKIYSCPKEYYAKKVGSYAKNCDM